jgi:uncharacterized protein YgiM (DUF1202 family)
MFKCVIGGGAALEKKAKSDRVKQKAQVAAASPVGQSVMYLSRCNVRSRPSTKSKIIARAAADTAYPVLEDKGRWKKISIDDTEGWTGCKDKR